MPQVVCLSEIIRFIKENSKNTKAFKGWFVRDEDDTDECLWIALLASAGHVITVIDSGQLVGLGFVLPRDKPNEYHLSQLLCTDRKYVKLLYANFKAIYPDGVIKTAFRRGRLVTFKNDSRFDKLITKF